MFTRIACVPKGGLVGVDCKSGSQMHASWGQGRLRGGYHELKWSRLEAAWKSRLGACSTKSTPKEAKAITWVIREKAVVNRQDVTCSGQNRNACSRRVQVSPGGSMSQSWKTARAIPRARLKKWSEQRLEDGEHREKGDQWKLKLNTTYRYMSLKWGLSDYWIRLH